MAERYRTSRENPAVLFVGSAIPYPTMGGHFIRAWGLVRALSGIADLHLIVVYRRSHEKLVGGSEEAVSNLCESARYIPMWDAPAASRLEQLLFALPKVRVASAYLWTRSDVRSAVHHTLDEVKPQVLWLDLYPMMYHLRLAAHSRVTTVMGTHNVESLRFRQLAAGSNGWNRLAALGTSLLESLLEKHYAPRYDVIVTVSQQNAAFYRKLAPEATVVVVPNFVDLSLYTQANPQSAPPDLCILGSMGAVFNAQSALWFVREILPLIWAERPDVKLFVVGHDPPREIQTLAGDRIVVTGTVPDAMEYLRRCAALVVPLRHGEGSRLKIVEAMASRVPVVSTSIGCEGLEMNDGDDILIADDPPSFAQAVLRLLVSPDYRDRIADNALRTAREKYSLEVNQRLLEQFFYP